MDKQYWGGRCANFAFLAGWALLAIIGPKLRARDSRGQRAEANVAVAVLNRMLNAGRPNSVRTSAVTG